MACSVAGITSDANVLTNFLRLAAQRSVPVGTLYNCMGEHDSGIYYNIKKRFLVNNW